MSNKSDRDKKEMQNLFGDPKFARQAWKSVGAAILQHPCTKVAQQFDKNGIPTFDSNLNNYTYEKLKQDIANIKKEDREPTELEMILACQIVKARFDTSAAVFVRDTLGAKPVDESKIEQTTNVFESMTDEELAMLKAFREKKAANEKK